MTPFVLHPRLANDCHQLGCVSSNLLLLHKNAGVRWFIVVPKTQLTALHDLPDPQYFELMILVRSLARHLTQRVVCDKVNIASIGNLVPQLHLHVIARHQNDPYWPSVVWGNLSGSVSYDSGQLEMIKQQLSSGLPQFTATTRQSPA